MNKKVYLILIAVLAVLSCFPPRAACASDLQTIFADPPSITATTADIGKTIQVNINITNGLDVWVWGVALKFNPTVLQCVGVYEGEFLKSSGETLWIGGSIDNATGKVSSSSATCTGSNLPVSGDGQLMYANFTIIAEGTSDIHLLNVMTATKIDSSVVATPCQVIDKYTITVNSNTYAVTILHNATGNMDPWAGIPDIILDQSEKSLVFNMTCQNALVFCNVTIPKTLLWLENPTDVWIVKVAGSIVSCQQTEDTENTYIYFTTSYPTSVTTKTVEIIGTGVIPEFPYIPTVTLALTILATTILLIKRKHS